VSGEGEQKKREERKKEEGEEDMVSSELQSKTHRIGAFEQPQKHTCVRCVDTEGLIEEGGQVIFCLCFFHCMCFFPSSVVYWV
jgi:hypothetical protein